MKYISVKLYPGKYLMDNGEVFTGAGYAVIDSNGHIVTRINKVNGCVDALVYNYRKPANLDAEFFNGMAV